jgi:hypothetical protein
VRSYRCGRLSISRIRDFVAIFRERIDPERGSTICCFDRRQVSLICTEHRLGEPHQERAMRDVSIARGADAENQIIGGGRRTRTFEVIRRLIYSQLPLPLGTLPRSTTSRPLIHQNGGETGFWMTLKPVADGGRPVGRVYEGIAPAKST